MDKIEALRVNDPERERVLGNADQIVKDYNEHGLGVINADFAKTILLAYVTLKRDHKECHNGWVAEGFTPPCDFNWAV